MAVLFYDNGILQMAKANVNIVGAVNVCLTNIAANQTNSVRSSIPIATNTANVTMTTPAVALATGNVQWTGDMVTFTATGDAYAANAVFYQSGGAEYLIAHYVLSNANYLALNDTFSIFCNQGIANIGDPNNFA